jgi:uncharacterized protein (DUF1697 family)
MSDGSLRMKYVALLRGINVGGKNIIRMPALRVCLEGCGFERVATYIQSGNVIFESGERDAGKLTKRIENALSTTFDYESRVVLRSHAQLKTVVADVPRDWKSRTDLRCYIAFLREPVTVRQALREVDVEPEVDFVTAGQGVLYMSTLSSGITRSGLTKVIAKKIYKDITIRNYSTCQKVLALMERS